MREEFNTYLVRSSVKLSDGSQVQSWGAFFWHYSGIEIHGMDGIRVLLGPIPVSE